MEKGIQISNAENNLVETHKQKVAIRIQYDRTDLAQRCRALSQHMISLAKKLESDKPHSNLCVNDLGEIQAEGTIIDALCGRLMGKIEVWGQIEETK